MAGDRGWKRRDLLRTGGVVAGGSTVAGCLIGDSDENDGGESDETNATGHDSNEDTGTVDDADDTSSAERDETDESTEDDEDAAITVSMPPVGEVAFESIPETWAANNGSWADMGIALGQDPPEAVYLANRYHTQYYDEIPGVRVDPDEIDSLWNNELTIEEFLSLSEDVDVFVMDPNFLVQRGGWSDGDIDLVESTGTPFFGNSSFSRVDDWHDYEYLSLYEAFEKFSHVFDETERYAAFESLHTEFQSRLDEIVPSVDERPEVAILWPITEAEFLPYVIDEGTSFKQWRDLGVRDAVAETDAVDSGDSEGSIDYESVLRIDPDVLLLRGNEDKSAEEFRNTVVERIKRHDIGSELTAVQNDAVYRGGPLYQGPISNLVVTERAARQLYDVDTELFDRQRVSDIVNGDF